MQAKYRNFGFYRLLFLLKFVLSYNLASASSLNDSIISSQIIAESSIILAKYFPFSQRHVARFET